MKTKKIKGMYFVVFENGVKIGISDDVRDRLRTYLAPWCLPVKEAFYFRCQYPRHVETKIKKRFAKNILSANSSEFVTGVDPTMIVNFAFSHRFARPEFMMPDRRFASCTLEKLIVERTQK